MTISVWTGYAVLAVSKSGSRKVIVGPATHLLEYDETLEGMVLSTGTPKNDDKLLQTVYVRALHNKVSDIVKAETKDTCTVHVRLSYRVNLEGDPNRWFNVENYVKFLTDHMRSWLRHAIKRVGQAFGDRAMVERVAQSMAPLAILGGKSVAEVLASLLKGTASERVLALGTGDKRESAVRSWRHGEESVRVADERLDIGSVANHAAPPD